MCAGQVVSELEVPPHGPPDGEAVNVAVNFWYQSNPFDTGCWPLSYTSNAGVNGVAFPAQPPRPVSSAVAVYGAPHRDRGVCVHMHPSPKVYTVYLQFVYIQECIYVCMRVLCIYMPQLSLRHATHTESRYLTGRGACTPQKRSIRYCGCLPLN